MSSFAGPPALSSSASMASLALLFGHLFILFLHAAAGEAAAMQTLPIEEQEAAYRVLESMNSGVAWRSLYPDDLCASGPHGVVCDYLPDAHVVELNFGYLSDFSANPPCGANPTIPPAVSAFPFLRKLFIYNCFVTGGASLPPRLWNLSSSLDELVLVENPSLGGRLTDAVSAFPRLRRLIISNARISGVIPGKLSSLRYLQQLVLSGNQLRGEIPGSVSRCRRLKVLDLSGNGISGSIPAGVGRIGGLLKLDLSYNMLTGRIPDELAGLQMLELLDLRYNNLTGGVPSAVGEMVSLREIYLSGNRLGGRIPEIWRNLGGVVAIGMSSMELSGSIPGSMGLFLNRLCFLALDNNFLSGMVPEELRRLELTAGEINLENNSLHGPLPFSSGFVERIGRKLKLGGNPNLCVTEELVNLNHSLPLMPCNGTTATLPELISVFEFSSSSSSRVSYFLFLLFVFVFAF